jgi:shikimate 5-dehydrogenase
MVYGAAVSPLATLAGPRYVDGRSVLACQGFAQFAAFTGHLPPKDAMLAALRASN